MEKKQNIIKLNKQSNINTKYEVSRSKCRNNPKKWNDLMNACEIANLNYVREGGGETESRRARGTQENEESLACSKTLNRHYAIFFSFPCSLIFCLGDSTSRVGGLS